MNDQEQDPVAMLVRLAGRRAAVDPERAARVQAAVEREWRATTRRRRWTRIAAVAGVAAAFGGVMLVRMPSGTAVSPAAPVVARVQIVQGTQTLTAGEALHAGAQLVVPANASVSLDWNGATLRLDGGTRLRLDAGDEATLQEGAVYYAGDSTGAGVTLHTPFGEVRDVGTRFEVRLFPDAVRVRVRDGAVVVRGTTAGAGRELLATRTTMSEQAVATSGEEWLWVERAAPPLLLEGRTLEEVLLAVSEEKGLALVWNDPGNARAVVLHGEVPLSASEALDAATAAAGVTYRIDGDRLVLGGRS